MFSSEAWLANSGGGGFYNEVATQSLRFDDGSNSELTRSPSSATNQKKYTLSCWVKRANIGSDQTIFSAGNSGSGNPGFEQLNFTSGDALRLYRQIGSVGNTEYVTTRVFRDVSAWYNIVVMIDAVNTIGYIYVNGVRETSFSTTNHPTNVDGAVNSTQKHAFGNRSIDGSSDFDGYLAEVNFLDGLIVGETSGYLDQFGEVKNGVWIPKAYSGSYGTNGFHLEFANTGTGTTSEGTTATTNIGDDSSGSGRNFAVSGINSYDCVPDSVENNWSTMNSIQQSAGTSTFSEGNLRITNSGARSYNTSTIAVKTGKWYAEMRWDINNSGETHFVGVGSNPARILHHTTLGTLWWGSNGNGYIDGSEVTPSAFSGGVDWGQHNVTTPAFVIGIALDLDSSTRTVTFTKDGGNSFSKNLPASFTDHIVFCMTKYSSSGTSQSTWNFGQDSTFVSLETVTSHADQNGFGAFHTAPPSGYLSLCSANINDNDLPISPTKTSQADDHFNTKLYTSDNIQANGTQNVTGVGFQPDWVWLKNRTSSSTSHTLYDSSRGTGRHLSTDGNGLEVGLNSQYGYLGTFGNDGYTLKGGSTNANYVNQSTNTYASWNWKAGGATPTKTYKVVVVSDGGNNKYRFRNSADSATFAQNAVTLDLQEGGTYIFDQSDSSNNNHPLRFSTTSNGTHASGSIYTTGVTVVGTPSQSGAYTQIVVATDAPTLYYFCTQHSGMGGQVNTNTTRGSTNFDGSILSVSQENTDAGFSIVKYTGTGSNGTVGHGLSPSVPELMIVKSRETSGYWLVYSNQLPNTSFVYLNITGKEDTGGAGVWNSTTPTNKVFSIGTSSFINPTSNMIAYIFHSVEGYSKFGSYVGNGLENGTFVYTGFRPAMVIVKNISNDYRWIIIDSVRDSFNPSGSWLAPNNADDEDDYSGSNPHDFLSNGFKLRKNTTTLNNSGNTFIYMAFAETPFKYSTAK